MDKITARYKIGDEFQYVSGGRYGLKNQRTHTVTDILTTTNQENDIVNIKYCTEHVYQGNLINDCLSGVVVHDQNNKIAKGLTV